jgi:hypothetical protein
MSKFKVGDYVEFSDAPVNKRGIGVIIHIDLGGVDIKMLIKPDRNFIYQNDDLTALFGTIILNRLRKLNLSEKEILQLILKNDN